MSDQLDQDFFAANHGRRYRVRHSTREELERGWSDTTLVVDCGDGDFFRASFDCSEKGPTYYDDEQTCFELFENFLKFSAQLQRGMRLDQGSERSFVSGHC